MLSDQWQDSLEELERRLATVTRKSPPNREQLKREMAHVLSKVMRMREWGFALVRRDVARTVTGQQDYPLPSDFGANFALARKAPYDHYYNIQGTKRHQIVISDGVSDSPLTYRPSPDFFTRNQTGLSNSKPSEYTVHQRSLWLYPPPDASPSQGYYTVSGSYMPIHWGLDADLPVSGDLLMWGVLARYDLSGAAEREYNKELQLLHVMEGRSMKARITPAIPYSRGSGGGW